jgi:hypothetical protein
VVFNETTDAAPVHVIGGDADADAFFEEAAALRAAEEEASRRTEDASASKARVDAVRAELVERLKASWTRTSDLFRAWDRDGDGKVSSCELRKGLDSIGIETTRSELAVLFASLDLDSSGSVSAKELAAVLNNRSARAQQPPPAAAAARSEPWGKERSLGRRKSSIFGKALLRGIDVSGIVPAASCTDGDGGEPAAAAPPTEEVTEAVHANESRTRSLLIPSMLPAEREIMSSHLAAGGLGAAPGGGEAARARDGPVHRMGR